jgi:hypothetical protein
MAPPLGNTLSNPKPIMGPAGPLTVPASAPPPYTVPVRRIFPRIDSAGVYPSAAFLKEFATPAATGSTAALHGLEGVMGVVQIPPSEQYAPLLLAALMH